MVEGVGVRNQCCVGICTGQKEEERQLLPALPGLYVRQVEKGSTAEQAFAMMQKLTTFFTHSLC